MADVYSPEERSRLMSRIRSRDTSLEQGIAHLLDDAGIAYERNVPELQGTPDFVIQSARVALFAHGCFWHGHSCKKGRGPVTGSDERDRFWLNKITANRRRDSRASRTLRNHGYAVITIWECELKMPDVIIHRVSAAIRRKTQK